MSAFDPLIPLPGLALPLSQLRAIVAAAERPQPVEGQVYRHWHTTDDEPHRYGYFTYRFQGGEWKARSPQGTTFDGEGHVGAGFWRGGSLVPYTPPRIVPQVGMILADNNSADVMRIDTVGSTGGSWTRLHPWNSTRNGYEAHRLTPDAYTVLDRYTVVGVKP